MMQEVTRLEMCLDGVHCWSLHPESWCGRLKSVNQHGACHWCELETPQTAKGNWPKKDE